MRILVVTPYPPARDGIAAYALQQVRAWRREGHDVEVLSPGPSAAHHHLDLVGPRGGLALARRVRDYDQMVVQFHPDFFYPVPSTPRQRAATSAAYASAFAAARSVEVVVHEIDYRYGTGAGPDKVAARAMWRAVDRVVVHTETERRDFAEAFRVPLGRLVLTAHGKDFARRTRHTRESARRSLGIDAQAFGFLSIGFLQPHKGFDRGIRAFAALVETAGPRAGQPDLRYDVVGSVRVEEPAYLAHAEELAASVATTPGVHLHRGYVSDELFDRWLVACDVVVLPYRSIWSSGVLERAALYDRPVIATTVGGLAEQAGDRPNVTLVADDVELLAAMARAVGADVGVEPVAEPWPTGPDDVRTAVQEEVRARAARRRGAPVARPARDGRTRRTSAGAAASSASLRRVAALQLPPPTAGRASAALVKRVVRRLTAWQVDPIVGQVNALQAAAVESLEQLAAASPPEPSSDDADRAAGPRDPRID